MLDLLRHVYKTIANRTSDIIKRNGMAGAGNDT